MSRHRDVRCMNYSDEYEGYDDVYGHSVEDEFCVSPGAEQFMYDRNKQADISSFLTDSNIAEGNEEEIEEQSASFKSPALSELESAKLMSCIETIRNVVGDTVPESELKRKIIELNYNAEAVLDNILSNAAENKSKEQLTKTPLDFPLGLSLNKTALSSKAAPPSFKIPKLTFKKRPDFDQDQDQKRAETNVSFSPLSSLKSLSLKSSNSNNTTKECSSLSELISSHNKLKSPMLTSFSSLKSSSIDSKVPQCSSLADLISNHKKLNSPKSTTEMSQNTNSLPFSSLSHLTSHHLQKSLGSSRPFQKESLSTKTFLSKKENELFPKTVSNVKNNFSGSNVNTVLKDVASLNFDEKDDKTADDEWEIDLSSALRTVDLAKPKISKVEHSETAKCENYSMNKSTSGVSNFDTCFFDLHNLRNAELQYARKTASPLGKVLCRKWKTKEPHAKKKAWYFQTSPNVTRFDFSVPSPDSEILQYLRKKI